MSTRYNFFGGLVTDGLVLNLDAAKLQSYPGSGTNWVNLINNPISGGTLYNGASITGSGKNLAITFDGTNDYTEILDNSIIDFGTSNFTSNIWIYPSSSLIGNTEYGIINKNNGYQNSTGWGLELSTYEYSSPFPKVDIIGFNSVQSSWGLSNVLAPIRTNTWSNVNLIRTGNKFDLYVNGSLSATKINSNVGLNVDNSVNLTLGKSSTWQSYFKGNISNFNLFNKPLSPFEVYQNFNALKGRYDIPDIVTSGLTLNLDAGNPYSYNPLNTGSTTWTDISGNGNNGTLTNGTYYNNGTMVFDGVDDYVNVPYDASKINFPDNNATICVWFNSTPSGDNYGALVTQRSSNSTGFQTYVYQNKFFADGGGVSAGVFSTTTVVKGTTYFGCALYDKTNSLLKIYVNGNYEAQVSYTGNIQDTFPIRLGNGAFSDGPYPGNIYAAQVYRRALSDTEILQNFNALRGRYGI